MKVSPATVSRYLARQGLVTPDPSKRPKSSYIRFAAEQPNECWQSDFTHYPLADGTDTEILTWLDDRSRCALFVTAHSQVTGPAVLLAFRAACQQHGIPASTLTDNGMVFTTRLSGGRGGRNDLKHELRVQHHLHVSADSEPVMRPEARLGLSDLRVVRVCLAPCLVRLPGPLGAGRRDAALPGGFPPLAVCQVACRQRLPRGPCPETR